MNRRLYEFVGVAVLISWAVGSCAPAPTATPTQPPAATAATPTPAATPGPTATAARTACAPATAGWDPTTANAGSRSITIAFEQEPEVAVGMFSNTSFAAWIWQMYGIGPGKWDSTNNLVAYAATGIPSTSNGGISADGLTITWKLKPCLFWSDGQPITSRDFLFTWKAMVDPANAPVSRAGWTSITGIDTPDDQTVVIHFKSLYPAWPTLFDLGPNNIGGGLLPEHIFTGRTGLEKDPQIHQPTWAGGPFAIKEWVAGSHMTLVRNPNYFGTPAKLDSIDIKFIPDHAAALAALKTGDVDLLINLSQSDIEAVNALAPQGIHLRLDPNSDFEQLFFNLGVTSSTARDPSGKVIGNSDAAGFCPFQEVNVRKAIMLGIDRLSFITSYLKEDQKAFIATVWPNSYWTNTSLQPYPYDPTQAASLLDAAGYKVGPDGIRAGLCDKKPVKFSLGIETTSAERRIAEMTGIQADLKQLGIDVKLNPIPAGSFYSSYAEGGDLPRGKFDMAIFSAGYHPDPDPGGTFLCSAVPNKENPSGGNPSHLCDPKLDALFAAGLSTADPAARKQIYDQIQQYIYSNALVIPLYAYADICASSNRLVFPQGFTCQGVFSDSEVLGVKE
ncbi:MAG TPA: peptide ABC transporter substrate-binding protein [Anaerolineales bacterium]